MHSQSLLSFLTSLTILLDLLSTASASAHLGSVRHQHRRDVSASSAESADAKTVEMVSATWFAGWHAADFPLTSLSWEKYTHVTYSFAVTTPDVTQLSLDGSSPELLPQFVSLAKKNGVKALVSVGGWTGSRFFSTNVGSAENRTQFVKTITDFVQKYDLDGIDFDWEYPAHQGIGCNTISQSTDTSNFLSFLQQLRSSPTGSKLILTAAVTLTPFTSPSGQPSSDISPFSKVLDYIAIMNYDVWGSWSPTVGPNAPLNDSCVTNATQKQGSAVSAVNAWKSAGMPASQIVLAVASYGHSFSVPTSSAFTSSSGSGSNSNQLIPFPTFNATIHPLGDKWDTGPSVDVCGVQEPAAGVFNFWGLIDGGFLNKDGSVNTGNGIAGRFDACSQTPYVYNPQTQLMVSYDNAQSFSAKGSFIKSQKLRGFAMWEAGGDSNDILLDSIRGAAGFDEGSC